MADLLDIPADASWPTFMTPPHPDAVGSYGAEAEEWILDELGITLRWWQKLSLRRSLEHDQAGDLVWQTVLESTPRRSGKSLLLKCRALVRVSWAERYGEQQLVLMTGKDLAICLEHHRKAWRWAENRGWGVQRKNGYESIESDEDGSRWIVRGRGSVYGYDVTMGCIDEAWDVDPVVVDEGMEPSILERFQPQLLITSTAHRKATPLMRRRIEAALTGMGEDFETLLMLWCAPADADITDEAVWRAASPHWSEHRRKLIAGKVERALRGEADPEADDPDPIEGLRAQYLNTWPEAAGRQSPGEPVFAAEDWEELNGYQPTGVPDVAAVENWFAEGVSVCLATRLADGRVGVTIKSFPDVTTAGEFAMGCGAATVLAGKALASDPALQGSIPVAQVVRLALVDLQRFAGEGTFCHDGSPELTEQALALRRLKTPDGQRVVSPGRMDALKAVSFAVDVARRAAEVSAVF